MNMETADVMQTDEPEEVSLLWPTMIHPLILPPILLSAPPFLPRVCASPSC